ncbi:unnamed protein product, partial [Prorocentrum cordatum]
LGLQQRLRRLRRPERQESLERAPGPGSRRRRPRLRRRPGEGDEARPDRGRANSSWYAEDDGWRRSRSVDRGGKEPSYDKPGFRKADAPRRPVDNPYSRSR